MGTEKGSCSDPWQPPERAAEPSSPRRWDSVPEIAPVNPALAAMASTLRVGDHLLTRGWTEAERAVIAPIRAAVASARGSFP